MEGAKGAISNGFLPHLLQFSVFGLSLSLSLTRAALYLLVTVCNLNFNQLLVAPQSKRMNKRSRYNSFDSQAAVCYFEVLVLHSGQRTLQLCAE